MSDTLQLVPEARVSDDPTSLPDGELARRVAEEDDRLAEAELYRRFAPRVRLYGIRHLRDPSLAEDLAQHVLLLALEKLRAGAVRELDRIGSFVLGTARLASKERRREKARWRELPSELEETVGQPPTLSPHRLERDALRECLHQLPERERAVVLASYYAERSSVEVGEELALTAGNVRVIRHRAIRGLRRCLGLESGRAA